MSDGVAFGKPFPQLEMAMATMQTFSEWQAKAKCFMMRSSQRRAIGVTYNHPYE